MNPNYFRVIFSSLLLSLAVISNVQTAGAQAASSGLLISVTFKTDNPFGNSPKISGPEPAATAADSRFAAAKVWNNLFLAFSQTTNPQWQNLLDSHGQATAVDLSITGTVAGIDLYPFLISPDPLRSAFAAWNSWTNGGGGFGPGESTSVKWELTGLPPNTPFDLCVYGSAADIDRAFDMTIQGTRMSIPTFSTPVIGTTTGSVNPPPPSCVLFSNIVSSANGTIIGTGAGVGDSTTALNESNWSGFQLVQLPALRPNPRIGFQRPRN